MGFLLLRIVFFCFQGHVDAAVRRTPTNLSQGIMLSEKRAWRGCADTTDHAVRARIVSFRAEGVCSNCYGRGVVELLNIMLHVFAFKTEVLLRSPRA